MAEKAWTLLRDRRSRTWVVSSPHSFVNNVFMKSRNPALASRFQNGLYRPVQPSRPLSVRRTSEMYCMGYAPSVTISAQKTLVAVTRR